jgi:NAD(P)H-quinone oxidoreductase subunit 5
LSPEQIVSTAWGIVAAPFLAGILIILFFRKSKTLSMLTSIAAVVYGFAHSLAIFYKFAENPALANIPPFEVPFFVSASFNLNMGVLVDNLAVMMLLVVTSVSLLVQIYTHGYMREDPGYSRFYAYLSLFTGSMLGLVVATNLFQTYVFWELVGVCSYFLIGFWWYKNSAAAAALKAFVINRIGDALFLVGILMLFVCTKDYYAGHTVLAFTGPHGFDLAGILQKALAGNTLTYWGTPGLVVLSLLVFCGPIAKSAQVPLHVWLPDAMEGPTPISALIHAATMVAAGIYLVARAYPLWQPPPGEPAVALHVIAWIGGITAFMAATIAMSQNDIKRALAWSTCSQLGYMFVGLGAGAFTGGLFHLFNHAFFKAMLFLCSGAVIHGVHGEQDMRNMGGLRKSMPITAACFLIGTISISGFPGFSGFFSKDTIISGAWNFDRNLAWLMILTAGMTAFYMFRAYFMTFHGTYRGTAHPHEAPPSMWAPLVVLAVPSVLSGYLGVNPAAWLTEGGKILSGQVGSPFHNAFSSFVYFGHPEAESINGLVLLLSVGLAFTGFFCAVAVYLSHSWNINTVIVKNMPALYRFSLNKWYFDELYMAILKGLLAAFNAVWTAVDTLFVDRIVNGTASVTQKTGGVLRYTQNGSGQYYALMIFGWVAVLTIAAYFLRP